jgi:hypothetical protein
VAGRRGGRGYWLGLLGALAPSLLVWILTVTREITLHFGYNGVLAGQFASGLLPYRDIPILAPPLNTLIIAQVHRWLGDSFLVYVALGLASRTAICWLMYRMLAAVYPPRVASLGAAVAGLNFACWLAEANWFTWHEIGFAVGLGVAIILMGLLDGRGRRRGPAAPWFLIVGLMCGLSIVSKQTLGLMTAALAALVAVLLPAGPGGRGAVAARLLPLGLGCGAVLAAMAAYLAHAGLLPHVLESTTGSAIRAKGGLATVLGHHFAVTWGHLAIFGKTALPIALAAALPFLASPFLARPFLARRRAGGWAGWSRARSLAPALVALAVLAAYLYVWASSYEQAYLFHKFHGISLAFGALAQMFVTLMAILCLARLVLGRRRDAGLLRAAIVSGTVLSLAYGMSLSQMSPDRQFYSHGLAFAALFGLRRRDAAKNLLLTLLACLCVFSSAAQKFVAPYYWYSWWGTPTHEARHATDIPALAGFRLGLPEKLAFEEIRDIVGRHTGPDEGIFVFNNAQILYAITERRPYTAQATHHIDLISDAVAGREARAIAEAPPPVIIYLREPEYVYRFFEQAYRRGKKSGLRLIDEAIGEMVAGGVYGVEAVFHRTMDVDMQKDPRHHYLPNLADQFSLRVLVRRDLLDKDSRDGEARR